jgi:hypothetical protein
MGNILPIDRSNQVDVRAALEYALEHKCYRQPARRAALNLALTYMGGYANDDVMRDIPRVVDNICEIAKHVQRVAPTHQRRLGWVSQLGKAVADR